MWGKKYVTGFVGHTGARDTLVLLVLGCLIIWEDILAGFEGFTVVGTLEVLTEYDRLI